MHFSIAVDGIGRMQRTTSLYSALLLSPRTNKKLKHSHRPDNSSSGVGLVMLPSEIVISQVSDVVSSFNPHNVLRWHTLFPPWVSLQNSWFYITNY